MSFVQRLQGLLEGFSDTPSLGLKGIVTADSFGDYYQRNGFRRIADRAGSWAPSWSGESVTRSTALNHSVVFACNRVISEPTGFLPLSMMQQTSKGRRVATEKPMYAALHDEPNSEMTAQEFRETRTSNCLMSGNGFAQIIRRSGTGVAVELIALDPDQVAIDRDREKRLVYIVRDGGSSKTYTVETGKPHDIFHLRGLGWDGMRGYSVLQMARQAIGIGLATERNLGSFYANGGRLPFHYETDKQFKNDKDFEDFSGRLAEKAARPHEALILENGLKMEVDGLSMADQQMLEGRTFTVSDICRFFNVSPDLAFDFSRATFSNMEHLGIRFVTFTGGPWFIRWEQALRRCILTPEEKAQGYYFKVNVNALMRGDFLSRMAGYASALQNGHMVIDEARDLEDRDPLPNGAGSASHVQTNMGTLGKDGIVQPPQDPAAAQLAANAATAAKKEQL